MNKKEKPKELVNLKNFFFLKKFKPNNLQLFDLQNEITDLLVSNKDSPFYKKRFTTVQSSISQIFSGQRNISKNFEKALEYAIEQKLKNQEGLPETIKEFKRLVKTLGPAWKLWYKTRLRWTEKSLKEDEEIIEKLKYTYLPNTKITKEDIQYLLSVVEGSGNKINLSVLMTLLKGRKKIIKHKIKNTKEG